MMKIMGTMAALLALLMPIQAGAKTLYGNADIGVNFITVDSTTGVATLVTTFNPAGQYFALEFTPGGTLWTIGYASGQLYTVEPATGVLTAAGNPGVNPLFTQLASDSNGNLYATVNTNDSLYSIDKVTGQAAAIGSTGIGSNVGISFDRTGTLYGADGAGLTLNTIDPATGLATVVAPITGLATNNYIGLAIDQDTGTAYLMDYPTPGSLYALDLATGVATPVGATGMNNHFDLAISWPAAAASDDGCGFLIPLHHSHDPWVLTVLTLLLLGMWLVRRRCKPNFVTS